MLGCFLLAFPSQVIFAHHEVKTIKKEKHYKYQLGLCAIFQNEGRFLKEWIEFHRLVGVQHFYLFNNLSTDDFQEILQPYIEKGIVELIEWPYSSSNASEMSGNQCNAYKQGIQLAKGKCLWLAIIDTDEFLVPVSKSSLTEILGDYSSYGGLGLNWQMYGTSHVSKVESHQLLIEKLLMKAPDDYVENVHIKSIVKPHRVVDCVNPHFFVYQEGYFAVNTNMQPCHGPFNEPVLLDVARINHYWPRDEEFFQTVKIPRRIKWEGQMGNFLERVDAMNQVYDPVMLKYVDEMKRRMNTKITLIGE